MLRFRRLALGLTLAAFAPLSILAATRAAHAEIVERVVAVVGDQAILLSEFHNRERPFLVRIYREVPPELRDSEIGRMHKELIKKMANEHLVAIAADKLNTTISEKEVDDYIKLRAADLKLQVPELMAEMAREGLTEEDYRQEVRRQLLFSKMLESHVNSRVRITEDDIAELYRQIQVNERRGQPYRASVITLELPAAEAGEARRAFADQLVKTARGGADFADLARKYSIDLTRDKGGDIGVGMPGRLGKIVDESVLKLDEGQVSEPLIVGNTIVIVKVTQRAPSQIPPYAEMHDQVASRARGDALDKQVQVWLDELKQGVFIDYRL